METSGGALSGDEQRLAELGYKQELSRGWSGFSNFAISFSIISVLAGCFTTYGQALNNGGPIAISIGWPVISLLILCVAFSMSELASDSALIGWIVLLAITFAIQRSKEATILKSGFPALTILETALSSAAAKAVILISTVGQLFCGMSCVTSGSRMTFAFSRDGAVPGHKLWRRLGRNRTPTWSVLFVILFAAIITFPAYFPNSKGSPVAILAVTSISVIGLYIAYTIPVFLRWRMGDKFQTGPWTLGAKYRWINPIAFVWVALCVIIFCLPFTPAGVYFSKNFSWSSVNYAPLVTIGVMAAVTIWYLVSARHSFKGPIRTIDLDVGGAPAAPATGVAPASPTAT